VRIRGHVPAAAEVSVDGAEPVPARAGAAAGELMVSYDGQTLRYACARDHAAPGGPLLWLGRDGHTWALKEEERLAAGDQLAGAGDGIVRSPMPGTVLAVEVAAGDPVKSGQPLLTVEAMKMEHQITAPLDGVVAELSAKPGQQAAMDEVLAVIRAELDDDTSDS
jgi:acetyl-CoA/propionyl-CoA carboxylase biotin carboxyl carrier protein